MENQLPIERLDLFDSLIRGLSTAIKNSSLYAIDHPVFIQSINDLKESIDNWFSGDNSLVIGVAQDNLLLNDSYVREENEMYEELSGYLHRRGVMVLTLMSGITIGELSGFVTVIKEDAKGLRDAGGILKVLSETKNLKIKALDYTNLLGRAGSEVSDEDQDVWKSLCSIGKDQETGGLPVSKEEFLKEFLKNSQKSAGLLNKVYKKALTQMDDEATVEDIRATMTRITRYFSEKPGQESVNSREELASVIGNLDPELVVKIFEASGQDSEGGLIREITGDLSDDTMSDMISSIISGEGGFNESLLKLFDKMMPEETEAGNLASMVVDNLFQKNMADKSAITDLKSSMKELVKTHPENSFMSEMYKITVDSFVSEKIDATSQGGVLAELVNEFKESLKEENLRANKIRLVLNLIWIENDSAEAEKLIERITEHCEQLIKEGNVGLVREIMQFFTDQLPKKEVTFDHVSAGTDKILKLIYEGNAIESIIKAIPGARENRLEDIAYVSSRLHADQKIQIIDAFLLEEDPFVRDKYTHVLSKMGTEIWDEIIKRLECGDFTVIKSLLSILKSIDSERTILITANLLNNKDAQVKLEALKGYSLVGGNSQDKDLILKLFTDDKNDAVRKRALTILISSDDQDLVNSIFGKVQKSRGLKKYLMQLVKLCGAKKMDTMIPHFEKILFKETFFYTSKLDELRIAVVVALGQINTPEAMELLGRGSGIKREKVKNMCEVVLKLEEHGKKTGKG